MTQVRTLNHEGAAAAATHITNGQLMKFLKKVEAASNLDWKRNEIQFPRLLSEVLAVLEGTQLQDIADSMDLTVAEVQQLFDRAESAY